VAVPFHDTHTRSVQKVITGWRNQIFWHQMLKQSLTLNDTNNDRRKEKEKDVRKGRGTEERNHDYTYI
jgi:hypothetical protein